jgi:hypothetical protein
MLFKVAMVFGTTITSYAKKNHNHDNMPLLDRNAVCDIVQVLRCLWPEMEYGIDRIREGDEESEVTAWIQCTKKEKEFRTWLHIPDQTAASCCAPMLAELRMIW